MTHWHYIAMAYGAFTLFVVWDYFAPRLSFKQSIRQLQLKMKRNSP